MLARQEIERRIEGIEAGLSNLARPETDLACCIDVQEHFEFLREQYRRYPGDLAWAVDQLAELRRRFDEMVSMRLAQVIDRFHEIGEQLRRAEAEKAALRDLLLRVAVRQRVDRLAGGAAVVRIRAMETRQLPPVGSELRERLEEAVRAAGCWAQVSQLSRPKLDKLLAAQQLPPAEAERIDKLCPVTILHQVSSQPL